MYQSKLMEALEISFFIAHVKLCIQSGIELLLETAFFSLSLSYFLCFSFFHWLGVLDCFMIVCLVHDRNI